MGTKRNTIIDELRIYDDAKHPEVSEYDVFYPKTIPSAVIDPDTNASLGDTLNEINNKLGSVGGQGSHWTTGTAISGTSTTDSSYQTGIENARVDDMYLNSSTYDVYRCTVSGDASTAKWVWIGNIKGADGVAGLGIYTSSATTVNTPGITAISTSTITVPSGRQLRAGDLIITANGGLYRAIAPDQNNTYRLEFIGLVNGRGISSTNITYQQTSSSSTSPPTGTWSSSIPSPTAGYYMWTKVVLNYTDGGSDTFYSVSRNGSNGSNATVTVDESLSPVSTNPLQNSTIYAALQNRLSSSSPTGSGSLSMNRRSNSTVGSSSTTYGYYCDASGHYSSASGYYSSASGTAAAAFGNFTKALGDYSAAFGKHNNNTDSTGATAPYCLFTIGFGQDSSSEKNVFRVSKEGNVYALSSSISTGADYSEYIRPWFDDNVDNEDRRGYLVTVRNGKLYKAEPGDYIVGITSGNPSVIGNGDEDWVHRWERDEFNSLIFKEVEVDDYEPKLEEVEIDGVIEQRPVLDEKGNPVQVKIGSHIEKQTVQVPDYDETQKYIERKDRPEWDCVGMIGIIPVRDDGTCEPGGFAKCRGYGIATKADEYRCHETFFVIERINDHLISVEMR